MTKTSQPASSTTAANAATSKEPKAKSKVLFVTLTKDKGIGPIMCCGTNYLPHLNESQTNMVYEVDAAHADAFESHQFVQYGRLIRAIE